MKSIRKSIQSLTLLGLMGAACCTIGTSSARAGVVASYNAGLAGNPAAAPDPTTPEGGSWTLNNTTAGDANFTWVGVSPDGETGSNAWRILDNSTTSGRFLYYSYALTAQQQADAAANGWKLSSVFRLQDPVAANGGSRATYLFFGNNVNTRFIAFFDITASGALDVNFQGTGGGTVVLTTDPAQANGYNSHEFLYDPATARVTYRFNGVVMWSNWSGTTGTFNGPKWGTESSGGRGDSYWNSVALEIFDPPPAPVVVQDPQSSTKSVGDTVTFNAVFTNLVLSYQWYKDGTPIPGATATSYSIPFVTVLDAADYVCRATNNTGFADTAPATLTVLPDTNAPMVASAIGSSFASRVRIRFTEPVLTNTATDIFNYEFQDNALVDSSAVMVDAFTVDLFVSSSPTPGSNYVLLISGIRDYADNLITNNTSVTVSVPSGLPLMSQLVAAFDGQSAVSSAIDGVNWLDRSGNENHAFNTSASPARRPIVVTNGLGGLPTLQFVRTNSQTLTINAATGVGLGGNDHTWFFVVKPTFLGSAINVLRHNSSLSSANWGSFFFQGNAGTGNQPALTANGRTSAAGAVEAVAFPVSLSSWVIGTGYLDATAGNVFSRVEDPFAGTSNAATNTAGTATGMGMPINTWIGSVNNGTFFDGEMAEVLIYSGVLDAAQRAEVEGYLRAKYFTRPTVGIRHDGANFVVEFTGTLLSGDEVTGITNVVPDATSPLVLTNGSPTKFYRSRLP